MWHAWNTRELNGTFVYVRKPEGKRSLGTSRRSWEDNIEVFPKKKQEVLGRTNRLLSLIRHEPHWKRRVQQFFYCCVCIRYRGNISTEPLPSTERVIFTEPLPSNNKGIFTEPFLSNDWGDTQTHTHTHTYTQQRDLLSPLSFFKIRKVG
jgi:hypothetical protein